MATGCAGPKTLLLALILYSAFRLVCGVGRLKCLNSFIVRFCLHIYHEVLNEEFKYKSVFGSTLVYHEIWYSFKKIINAFCQEVICILESLCKKSDIQVFLKGTLKFNKS